MATGSGDLQAPVEVKILGEIGKQVRLSLRSDEDPVVVKAALLRAAADWIEGHRSWSPLTTVFEHTDTDEMILQLSLIDIDVRQ